MGEEAEDDVNRATMYEEHGAGVDETTEAPTSEYCWPQMLALRRRGSTCCDPGCTLSGGYGHAGACEPCACPRQHAAAECPVLNGWSEPAPPLNWRVETHRLRAELTDVTKERDEARVQLAPYRAALEKVVIIARDYRMWDIESVALNVLPAGFEPSEEVRRG